MSPVETICIKCQILFSEKIRKSSAESAKRVVKIKVFFFFVFFFVVVVFWFACVCVCGGGGGGGVTKTY